MGRKQTRNSERAQRSAWSGAPDCPSIQGCAAALARTNSCLSRDGSRCESGEQGSQRPSCRPGWPAIQRRSASRQSRLVTGPCHPRPEAPVLSARR